MDRGNKNNLVPNEERTPEQRRKNAQKAGRASGEVRREKKSAREVAKMVLGGTIPLNNIKELVANMGLPESDMNVQAAIVAGQAMAAVKGNTRAGEWVMSLIGDADKEDKLIKYAGLPARIIGREWADINRDIDNRKYRFYDFKGGRGSLKSTFAALKLVDQIMLNDVFCALAVRQLKEGLKDSVYSQIIWAIDELGLTEQFHCTKSPMEIIRKETGQVIYFRGADQPMKIKSLRPPKGMYIGVVWFEEADQIKGLDAYNDILQSAMRGGNDTLVFRSYNVPRSQAHFINRDALTVNPARIIHHSHFKNVPAEWLGQGFYDLAESIRATNPMAYRHMYDGEAVGNGASVFENVKIDPIPQEAVDKFAKIYCGLDWGYFPDPLAFVVMSYDSAQRKLYIYDELFRHKTGNKELALLLQKYKDYKIIADSAEPKSIQDMKTEGYIMYGAKKGPGSVDYGIKWLASLSEIVIDPKRCPNTAREFREYEYERDSSGNIISGYPDADNHCVTGDTIVNTVDGDFRIDELVGKTGDLYCYDTENECRAIGKYGDVRKTGNGVDVFEIELEDGRVIHATDYHPILTDNGWQLLKDLEEGDNIIDICCIANYAKIANIRYIGKQDVYNMEVGNYHCFSVNGGLIVHNCIDSTRYALEEVSKRGIQFA